MDNSTEKENHLRWLFLRISPRNPPVMIRNPAAVLITVVEVSIVKREVPVSKSAKDKGDQRTFRKILQHWHLFSNTPLHPFQIKYFVNQ